MTVSRKVLHKFAEIKKLKNISYNYITVKTNYKQLQTI